MRVLPSLSLSLGVMLAIDIAEPDLRDRSSVSDPLKALSVVAGCLSS